MGYRSDDHRYVFLESDNPSEARNIRIIGPALREYLRVSQGLGPNTSLVIIGQPSSGTKSVSEYNNTFWEMLRGLWIIDTQTWPEDIPAKILSEKWTFAFDGEPIFPVMLTPGHARRWSRQMSVPLMPSSLNGYLITCWQHQRNERQHRTKFASLSRSTIK